MLASDAILANICKFREQGTMSNAHAVFGLAPAPRQGLSSKRGLDPEYLHKDGPETGFKPPGNPL